MDSALIALIGVLIGILTNEYLRRNNRIEKYSEKLFDKKLEIYKQLYQKIQESALVIENIINNGAMSTEMRNENVSKIILDIADFLEPIEFYLEQEVIIQSMTVFMGVEDICPNNADSHELIKMYRKNLKHTKMLIQDVSGVKQANLSFRNITRAQLNTPILEYFQKIQRKVR